MRLAAIVAVSRDGLIGSEHGLPWHLPRDLKRFRSLTWGKPIIMGRKTRDFIGRPLPGRTNIVLTRDPKYVAEGCRVAHSFDEALGIAAECRTNEGPNEVMVIGGGEVYRQALPRCERIYVTVVDGQFTGDTYFPKAAFARAEWQVAHEEVCPPDEKNPHPHRFYVLDRKRGGPLSSSGEVHEVLDALGW